MCMSFAQKLIDHGADVNAVDEDGNTALHLVCTDEARNITVAISVLVSAVVAGLVVHHY